MPKCADLPPVLALKPTSAPARGRHDGNPPARPWWGGGLTVDDDDLTKIIGIAQVTKWATFADNGMGFALDLSMPFVLPSDKTSLFCAIVERGTAGYVSASDLTLKVGIMAA